MDPMEGCSRFFLEDEEDYEEPTLGGILGEEEDDGPQVKTVDPMEGCSRSVVEDYEKVSLGGVPGEDSNGEGECIVLF